MFSELRFSVITVEFTLTSYSRVSHDQLILDFTCSRQLLIHFFSTVLSFLSLPYKCFILLLSVIIPVLYDCVRTYEHEYVWKRSTFGCLPQCSPLYFLDSLSTKPGAHQFDYTLASKSHESKLRSSCLCSKHCINWAVSLTWKSESHLIAQTNINLTPVLLPQSPECWECQHEPPYPHSSILIF